MKFSLESRFLCDPKVLFKLGIDGFCLPCIASAIITATPRYICMHRNANPRDFRMSVNSVQRECDRNRLRKCLARNLLLMGIRLGGGGDELVGMVVNRRGRRKIV